MTEKKLFIFTDLGGGDGGKGGIVHAAGSRYHAHTFLKVGGAQGSHGVSTKNGQNYNFSQFGCGTFEGARTHITDLMVIEPYRLLQEAEDLKYQFGIGNIFSYLTIDERALCATPFHTIASRLRELNRRDNPKGTIGIGAGEAVLDAENHPELALYAADLNHPTLPEKLTQVRSQKIIDLQFIIEQVPELNENDKAIAEKLLQLLNDEKFTERIVERFNTLYSLVKIVPADYLPEKILARDGNIVVESSHGILTDRYYGFQPHVSSLRTTPEKILAQLTDYGYDGEIIKTGITRAYQIRHGAGPMVTESEEYLQSILPNSSKLNNRWQGKVRIGPLDLVTLRYAIDVCGGPQFFDGLAITWFDQVQALGKWEICPRYYGTDDPNHFVDNSRIKVRRLEPGDEFQQIEHQKILTKQLFKCRPEVMIYENQNQASMDFFKSCTDTLSQGLSVPVKILSFGPTEDDKIYI